MLSLVAANPDSGFRSMRGCARRFAVGRRSVSKTSATVSRRRTLVGVVAVSRSARVLIACVGARWAGLVAAAQRCHDGAVNLVPRLEFVLQSLYRRQQSCPFCASGNHSVVARKRGILRIRHCLVCGLYFTDPIYRSRLGNLYDRLYRAEGSTTTLPAEPALEALRTTNFARSDKNCAPQLEALQRLTDGRSILE